MRKPVDSWSWGTVCRIILLYCKAPIIDAKARPWSNGFPCTPLTIGLECAKDSANLNRQHCNHAARQPNTRERLHSCSQTTALGALCAANQRKHACQLLTPLNIPNVRIQSSSYPKKAVHNASPRLSNADHRLVVVLRHHLGAHLSQHFPAGPRMQYVGCGNALGSSSAVILGGITCNAKAALKRNLIRSAYSVDHGVWVCIRCVSSNYTAGQTTNAQSSPTP